MVAVAAQEHLQRPHQLSPMLGVISEQVSEHIQREVLELRAAEQVDQQPLDAQLSVMHRAPPAEESLPDRQRLKRHSMRRGEVPWVPDERSQAGRDAKLRERFRG